VRPTNATVLDPLAVSPWTRYEYAPGTVFRPAPGPDSTSGVRAGMLDLSTAQQVAPSTDDADTPTPSWALVTFDVDNATQTLRHAAATLPHGTTSDQNPQITPPTIRSMGLGLLRPDRGAELAQRAQNGPLPGDSTALSAELTADDLILGYRVDIKTGDGDWLPLCERDASYTVAPVPSDPNDPSTSTDPDDPDKDPIPIAGGVNREEGHVKPFAAIKVNDALLADEFVARWQGWGLALPIIKLVDDTTPAPAPVGDQPYLFDWVFSPPPARLPKLRFATDYQMRVRVGDMAGGGVKFTDPPAATPQASPAVHYTRYDPIPSPLLQSDLPTFGTGAAIDRLVIRSNPDGSLVSGPTYPVIETRGLAAPSARLALVEQHGILDARSDEESWPLVARAIATNSTDPDPAGLVDPAAAGVMAFIAATPGGPDADMPRPAQWKPAWPDPQPKTLTLTTAPAGSNPIGMQWSADGTALAVTLGIAKEAIVELTSTMNTDLQTHFEATNWLTASAQPAAGLAAALAGRNPAVSPVRPVLCINAVRCPLSEPLWTLPPQDIQRDQHQTSVVLTPQFTDAGPGNPGLNTDSTGRLDVAATWVDTQDSGPQAAIVTTAASAPGLFSATIDPGPPPALAIRHEFGDTRHRTVTYTLNAVTRYRQYFADTDEESLFHLSRVQDPVQIVSSARPAPLTLLGAVPAFAWQPPQIGTDRIDHLRQGGRIRVEVARPWFSTGDGECLAVIIAAPNSTPADPDPVTRMGRDPLFGAPPTPLYPSVFTGAGAAVSVALSDLTDATGPTGSTGSTGSTVMVLPYQVSPDVDRWYADITMDPAAVAGFYNPFVQLAVARYQPFSLPTLELSPAVLTDMVPLLPDRHLTVVRSGAALAVTLTGAGPDPANPVVATLEQASGSATAAGVELVSTDSTTDGMPAWIPVASVTGVVGAALPTLTVPTGLTALRLRVTEHEALQAMSGATTPPELGQRTVFLDTIAIPDQWH
jgi:hypothetical protein